MARGVRDVRLTPSDEFYAALVMTNKPWRLLCDASKSLGYESTLMAWKAGRWPEVISEAVEAQEAIARKEAANG
jgi:hypothetical protein